MKNILQWKDYFCESVEIKLGFKKLETNLYCSFLCIHMEYVYMSLLLCGSSNMLGSFCLPEEGVAVVYDQVQR